MVPRFTAAACSPAPVPVSLDPLHAAASSAVALMSTGRRCRRAGLGKGLFCPVRGRFRTRLPLVVCERAPVDLLHRGERQGVHQPQCFGQFVVREVLRPELS